MTGWTAVMVAAEGTLLRTALYGTGSRNWQQHMHGITRCHEVQVC